MCFTYCSIHHFDKELATHSHSASWTTEPAFGTKITLRPIQQIEKLGRFNSGSPLLYLNRRSALYSRSPPALPPPSAWPLLSPTHHPCASLLKGPLSLAVHEAGRLLGQVLAAARA